MFNASINIRLKMLFDKMYISRNVFEKMKSLIASLDTGSYSYNSLITKATELVDYVNNIANNIEGLSEYSDHINNIKTMNTAFNDNFDNIVLIMINRYIQILNKLLTDIELQRATVETSDRNYLNNPGATVEPYNTPEIDAYGKYFIPTDDVCPWNSIVKNKSLGTNDLIVFAEDYAKIDPKNESIEILSGGVESKKLSRDSIILDMLVDVKNSGFSLLSINSKSGQIYSYIEDNYEANVVANSKDDFYDGNRVNSTGVLTTKPAPGVAVAIKEFEGYSLSIRRHGEFSDSPTKFFASIK